MIAACPKCKTRYRVNPERLTPDGLRLRCKACGAIFRVKPPTVGSGSVAADPAPTTVPATREGASEEPLDRGRLVLVAHPQPEAGKRISDALRRWGLQAVLAHDGVEAILTLQRTLPRAVILDAALPKMYGFQVCELVKRNESLRSTWVVLLGAVHHPDRYRRPPNELYGADAYLEPSNVPDGLLSTLRRFGLPIREVSAPAPAPPTTSPTPVAAPPPASTPTQVPQGTEDSMTEERAKAERLARIIVSDIVLYNEEKFAAAVRTGDAVAAMSDELDEGRALFRERIDPDVREERDYLADELSRVARSRQKT